MTSPLDPLARSYSHINGSEGEKLDRFAISELCKGWPVYRDASEWKNFRSLFADDAYVWTTWSGALPIEEFIRVSKEGKEKGDFIMHRECGTLVELTPGVGRAVGKMKATITQRFRLEDGTEMDVDCDCRFIFFCEYDKADRAWKAKFVKLFYEKDKLVPVGGSLGRVFTTEEELEMHRYPVGYRYLAAMQKRLGYTIDLRLPTCGNEGWHHMYAAMENWLAGHPIDLF